MVVGCRDGFNLYDMMEFKAMYMVSRPSGFGGLYALSQVVEGNSYLAIPVSEKSGDIEIFDAQVKVGKSFFIWSFTYINLCFIMYIICRKGP